MAREGGRVQPSRMRVRERDRKFLARDSEPDDVQVTGSDGSYVYGPRRKRYIDFTSGWCVGNLGWGNEEIRAAVRDFDGPDYVAPGYLYSGWSELADLLAGIAPGKLTKCFRATGGTEAVEIALHAAIAHTRRTKFVSIEDSYHGDSIATMSIGSVDLGTGRSLLQARRIKPPLDDRAVGKVETALKRRDVAAFIMEPVICNLGALAPTEQFVLEVRELCRRYGTLFIADEVASGFERTGKLFACEHYGLEPDLLCLAKAITSGCAPLGATLATPAVARSMAYSSSYYSTYGWHPRSVAAAIATIRFIRRHQREIEAHVEEMSRYFRERLLRMPFREQADVRVVGLAIGVEFENDEYATAIADRARQRGLLISEESGELFTLFPPLNVAREVAAEGLDILSRCL